MLGDVCGWLVLNSMLSDRLQFNVLQTQNLSNIWRKNAWNTLMEKYALLQLPEIVDCIEVWDSGTALLFFSNIFDSSPSSGLRNPMLPL